MKNSAIAKCHHPLTAQPRPTSQRKQRSSSDRASAGEATTLFVVAVQPDGSPHAGSPAEIRVVRRTWNRVREKGMDEILLTGGGILLRRIARKRRKMILVGNDPHRAGFAIDVVDRSFDHDLESGDDVLYVDGRVHA